MYLISGTVEESIYELSVARRLAHIIEKEKLENNDNLDNPDRVDEALIEGITEKAIDSANSMEIEDSSLKGLMASSASGGEIVKNDDLWQCLFGKSPPMNHYKTQAEHEEELRELDPSTRRGDLLDLDDWDYI